MKYRSSEVSWRNCLTWPRHEVCESRVSEMSSTSWWRWGVSHPCLIFQLQ